MCIIVLLYVNTGSMAKAAIVLLAVPFSAIGAVWLLYLLHYNMSVAVWVGLIALAGVDAETGVFMLLYLDLAYEQAKTQGRLAKRCRLAARHHAGSGAPDPPEVHDRRDHVPWSDSNHAGDGHGR